MSIASLFRLGLVAAACGVSASAWAQPAVVFDMGGKFDKSFNQAAYAGIERWKKKPGKTTWNSKLPTKPSASRPYAAWPSGVRAPSSA